MNYSSRPKTGVVLVAGVLLTAALALAVGARFYFPLTRGFLEKTEQRTLDARFRLRGALPLAELQRISKRVAIVAMDDDATQKFGATIPRQIHAQLVSQLKKDGAKAIIFDVIFADPAPQNPAGDAQFEAAMRKAGNVFLPFDHDSARETPLALLEKTRRKLSYPISVAATAQKIHIRPPTKMLFDAMKSGGHIATRRDSDGTFRSSILLMEIGAVYPHTVLDAVAQTEWNVNPRAAGSGSTATGSNPVLRNGFLQIGERKIGPLFEYPLRRSRYENGAFASSRTGTAWAIPLNFLGGHAAMQVLTVPYLDALEGRAGEKLKNRIVIIGATATGTPDLRRSPFDTQDEFLGVETNATLIANLLDNNFLRSPSPRIGVLWAVLLGALAGIFAWSLRPGISLLLTAGVLGAYFVAAIYAFIGVREVWEMTAPLASVAFCYLTLAAWRAFVADSLARDSQLALRETQTLLGQYVNQNLAQSLANDSELRRDMQIGTRREVTVLFSDIRDFTLWSEGQTPEEVKARLDEYFSLMCEIVADDNDGYIDKFIGDGMMAVWNGMSDQNDHARRAVCAALSMKRALALLNDGWRRQKQSEFRFGIGIATGSAVFGTFGSPKHKLMPTVLGDTVNLASRLEELTKETGAVIIVSQSTYEQVQNDFEFRALGEVPVRGKSKVQQAYEVLALKATGGDAKDSTGR